MTFFDEQTETLQAKSSSSCYGMPTTLLYLALATVNPSPEAVAQGVISYGECGIAIDRHASSSSGKRSVDIEFGYGEIMQAMVKAYDQLLVSQKEFDREAERILYDNLWDLCE